MVNTIKTVIVDDNTDFREALKIVLNAYHDVEIVQEACDGKEFIDNLGKSALPDLVFMDIDMPKMNGIDATRLAIQKYGKLNIVALSFHAQFEYTRDIIYAGARNYLIKNDFTKQDLDTIIKQVKKGR